MNRSYSSIARVKSGGAVKFNVRHCSSIDAASWNASRGCLRSIREIAPTSDCAVSITT
jgi:hypothetical protein